MHVIYTTQIEIIESEYNPALLLLPCFREVTTVELFLHDPIASLERSIQHFVKILQLNRCLILKHPE